MYVSAAVSETASVKEAGLYPPFGSTVFGDKSHAEYDSNSNGDDNSQYVLIQMVSQETHADW